MCPHTYTHTNIPHIQRGERSSLGTPAIEILNRLKTVTFAWGDVTHIPQKRAPITPVSVPNQAGAEGVWPSSVWIIHISSIFWRGVKLPFWHVCGFWGMCSHLIITRWWTPERVCNCLQTKVFVSPVMHDFRTIGVPLWPQRFKNKNKNKNNSREKEDNHSFPLNF